MAEAQNTIEGLYTINNELYLHLQECDSGFDYTLYDRNTLKELDGGQLDWDDLPELPTKPLPAARVAVYELEGIVPQSEYSVPIEFLETLIEVNLADAEVQRENFLDKLFMESNGDNFAIYQLKHDDSTAQYAFMNTDWLQRKGLSVQRGNYEHTYTAKIDDPAMSNVELLNSIYERFNLERPENFHGHSLSVSDIVALKRGGTVSFHYVDSIGFKEIPTFLKPENQLRNAEMAVEDDYGMIDGIINNGKKDEPTDIISQLRRELPKPSKDIPKSTEMER